MYHITNYSKMRASELNVHIYPSRFKKYKIDVYDKNNNYITSIGSIDYLDYPNYIIKYGKPFADERRRLYAIRHNSDSHIIGSRGYYAKEILW